VPLFQLLIDARLFGNAFPELAVHGFESGLAFQTQVALASVLLLLPFEPDFGLQLSPSFAPPAKVGLYWFPVDPCLPPVLYVLSLC
jgi:hypothetical protein